MRGIRKYAPFPLLNEKSVLGQSTEVNHGIGNVTKVGVLVVCLCMPCDGPGVTTPPPLEEGCLCIVKHHTHTSLNTQKYKNR